MARNERLDRPNDEVVIPLVEERINIDKVTEERGKVQIKKTVRTEKALVNEELLQDSVEVERTPINQFVDEAPKAREEDGVIIVPVVEEVMVKRLRLREEIRLVKKTKKTPFKEEVEVRRTEVSVDRSS